MRTQKPRPPRPLSDAQRRYLTVIVNDGPREYTGHALPAINRLRARGLIGTRYRLDRVGKFYAWTVTATPTAKGRREVKGRAQDFTNVPAEAVYRRPTANIASSRKASLR
jgi:hypothetical protein